MNDSIHQFSVVGLEGETIHLAACRGKKILVVNVASECGYTPQYQQLQELHAQFGQKLCILGFPCNDFGSQEPGTSAEIRLFCEKKYGVTFPLTEKVSIKGDNSHPVYQWLTRKELNGKQDSTVSWNFQKYLLDEEGRLMAVLPPSTDPLSDAILDLL